MRNLERVAPAIAALALITAAGAGADEREAHNAFGQQMRAMLVERYGLKDARYDEACFCIRHSDGVINLHNFYNEVLHERLDAATVAERISGSLLRARVPGAQILPALRERYFIELQANLQSRLLPSASAAGGFPLRVVGDQLALTLVEDQPKAMGYLSSSELQKRGLDFARVLEQATAALLKRQPPNLRQLEAGVYMVEGDDYAGTHFLLGRLHESMRLQGDPVAVFVNNHVVFVTGERDLDGLGRVAVEVESASEAPRSWSPRALRLHGGRWEPWKAAASLPVFRAYEQMRRKALALDYEIQSRVLEKFQESLPPDAAITRDEHAFPARYILLADKTTHELRSIATLAREADTLLPVVDEVVLQGPDDKSMATVPWDRFIAAMGKGARLTDLWPRRYRVAKFPSDKQIAQMRSGH